MRAVKPVSVLIFIVACLTQSAIAENCDSAAYANDDYRLMLDEFSSGNCFKQEHNKTPLGIEVTKLLDNTTYDQRVRALQALAAIQQSLQINLIDPQTTQQQNAKALNAAIEKLKEDIHSNLSTPSETVIPHIKRRWKLDRLDRLPEAIEGLDFSTTLTDARCAKVADRLCEADFEVAADLVRAIQLVNAAVDHYTDSYREETLQHRALRTAMWDSYYDDLTFQYPWELLANNWLLEKYDTRAVVDGNKLGFRNLPGSKLVVLHPEVNLVYADNAEEKYAVTVTVEAVGFEVFDFDRRSGKVMNPWGISLLGAYLERPEGTDSGWVGGLLFKYDSYSLGITDNHGETAVVFNVNLAQKLFDVEQKSRYYYDEYKDRIQQMDIIIDEVKKKLEESRQLN